MADRTNVPEVVVWTDARHAQAVDGLLALMLEAGDTIELLAIGGPRVAAVDAIAKKYNAPRTDDLRHLLVEYPASQVLLADENGVSLDDLALAARQSQGVAMLEPAVADLSEHTTLMAKLTSESAIIELLPAFDRAPGWSGAADPTEALGKVESVSMISLGTAGGQSLFARLYDAWRMVLSVSDAPETIDASLAGPLTEAPQDLRALTGHLAIHARLGHGRSAVLQVSDRGGPMSRTLHVIGDKARLRVSDTDYDLHDIAGPLIDQSPTHAPPHATPGPQASLGDPQNSGAAIHDHDAAETATTSDNASDTRPDPTERFVQLAADHWRHVIQRRSSGSRPISVAAILSCAAATLLSTRTGQPESPATLLAMKR